MREIFMGDELPMAIEPPVIPVASCDALACGLRELVGFDLKRAKAIVRSYHYTHTTPKGKSHWLAFESAIVVWSIPANCNIGTHLTGEPCCVWELSRLWAPDGHPKNLLTRAVSSAVKWICCREKPDVLISYADPNAGHHGGVYRAASWIYTGQSEESRAYVSESGQRIARRSFHSGNNGMTKKQIESIGYREVHMPGKHRYVKAITRKARRILESNYVHA